MSQQKANIHSQKNIRPEGGSVIDGDVSAGNDFVGRDQLNIEQIIMLGPGYADLTDLGERVRQNLGFYPA